MEQYQVEQSEIDAESMRVREEIAGALASVPGLDASIAAEGMKPETAASYYADLVTRWAERRQEHTGTPVAESLRKFNIQGLKSRYLLEPGGDDALVERLKQERKPGRRMYQGGNPLAERFAVMPAVEADSTRWFGEGKEIDADSAHLRRVLLDWAKRKFPDGMLVTNSAMGWEVQVTPAGVKSSLHHGYDELLAKSVPFIPQIVESGIYLDSIEKKPGLVSHIFANKIRLDGKDYVAGFVLREDRAGNRFYDHEMTEIINPDWLKPGRDTSVEALGHRTNRGDVMNILRDKLGVNDGSGSILFQSGNNAHAVVEVRGDELGVPEGSPIKDYQKAAREVYSGLQKTPARREDLGGNKIHWWRLQRNETGWSGPQKMAACPKIDADSGKRGVYQTQRSEQNSQG